MSGNWKSQSAKVIQDQKVDLGLSFWKECSYIEAIHQSPASLLLHGNPVTPMLKVVYGPHLNHKLEFFYWNLLTVQTFIAVTC